MACRLVIKRRQFVALLLVLVPLAAAAGKFTSITPSPDTGNAQSRLTITISDGTRFEAPKDAGQVDYENSYVSSDGKYVGWLAEYSLAGIDGPIPEALFVLDLSRKLHRFDMGDQAIFQWCFVPKVAEVAYMQGPLHGDDGGSFFLRKISSGHLLATYDIPNSTDSGSAAARKNAPPWVQCVLKQEAANYVSMWKH